MSLYACHRRRIFSSAAVPCRGPQNLCQSRTRILCEAKEELAVVTAELAEQRLKYQEEASTKHAQQQPLSPPSDSPLRDGQESHAGELAEEAPAV